MGLLIKLILLAVPVGLASLYFNLTRIDPIPVIQDEYWGPTSERDKKEDTSVRPFKIDVPDDILQDLKMRLKWELDSNRLAPPLEGIGFEYGFNSNYLKSVGQYWLDKYDWRAREVFLNKYPQFKTKIGGLDIQFYHVKPKAREGVEVRPLLLMHGWPGSVVEFQKIIPLLSEPKNSKFTYELIIPSLPGYGWSEAAKRPGLHLTKIANIFKRLMERLGHNTFFVVGGNWGSIIASDIATLYPDRILGAHSLHCVGMNEVSILKHIIAATFPSIFSSPEMTPHVNSFTEYVAFQFREKGYAHLHGTKPDTVGAALSHSPLGLAAYILEKFSTWTNRTWMSREDGGLEEKFTLDELLDNVMVYWVTGSITTSQRLFAEFFTITKTPLLNRVPTNVPFVCLYMPGDVDVTPEYSVRDKFTNLKRFSPAPRGGHFAAYEEPEILAQDILSFFNSL